MSTPMNSFEEQFKIIYQKFADWATSEGFKPNRTAFARHIGVSQGCMQKWEKGQRPTAPHIKLIHDKLGFSYDWLITGEGEPMNEQQKQIEALEQEVKQLRTQLLHDGVTDEKSLTNIGTAAGQE